MAPGWALLSGWVAALTRVRDILRSPIPRHEFLDALGRVIRQARQHFTMPSLWVDVIELGGGDEAVDGSRTPTALIGPGSIKPVIVANECDQSHALDELNGWVFGE